MTMIEDPTEQGLSDGHERSGSSQPKRAVLNTDTVAMASVFIAAFAFLAAVFAIALAARSIDEHRAVVRASAGATTVSGSVNVSLKEFAIAPGAVNVPVGTSAVVVKNDGTVMHNLSIDGIASPMLDGGQGAELDISKLAPGTYVMRCDVPGHEAAGMKGTFTVN